MTAAWRIGQRLVDQRHPLLIAEVASAHEGRLEEALALVEALAAAGVEAVKFQCFAANELVAAGHPQEALFRRLEFSDEQWRAIIARVRHVGLLPLLDVFGERGWALAQALDLPAVKLPSATVTDASLVPQVAAWGRPALLSAAGATSEEVHWAVEQFRQVGHPSFVVLHGFQGFPTPVESTHLRRLTWLQQTFACPVGLSDHPRGESAAARELPLVALGLGAIVFEKHVTRDRSQHGLDWVSALEPSELGALRRSLEQAAQALGSTDGDWMPGEEAYRRAMRRRLVAARAIPAGTRLTRELLAARRTPAVGALDPLERDRCVGRITRRALAVGEALTAEALVEPSVAALIAVRMKSTRLPRKALADLAGRSVIERLIERLRTSQRARQLVLCTSTLPEDRPLVDIAQRLGVACVCGDPDDVMARFLQAARQVQADIIIRVTGDNPLTDADIMDHMIDAHIVADAEYTYTDDLPFGTRAEVISVPALRRVHALAEDPSQTEYMTLYLKQPDVLRVHRYAVQDARLVRPQYRLTLDTPEDLALLQHVYQHCGHPDGVFPLTAVTALLDSEPALVQLNAQVQQRDLASTINTRLRQPGAAAMIASHGQE